MTLDFDCFVVFQQLINSSCTSLKGEMDWPEKISKDKDSFAGKLATVLKKYQNVFFLVVIVFVVIVVDFVVAVVVVFEFWTAFFVRLMIFGGL